MTNWICSRRIECANGGCCAAQSVINHIRHLLLERGITIRKLGRYIEKTLLRFVPFPGAPALLHLRWNGGPD